MRNDANFALFSENDVKSRDGDKESFIFPDICCCLKMIFDTFQLKLLSYHENFKPL